MLTKVLLLFHLFDCFIVIDAICHDYLQLITIVGRVKTECDGTRAETRFGLPAKWTSPFISAGVSVQSAAGGRGVCISGSNAG